MQPRIVVIGSLMMDLVVRAPRLPVAGESLVAHSFQRFTGGKGGNQAIAAARLGAAVTMIGKVGADAFGRELIESLQREGIDTSHVVESSEVTTGVAVPIVLDNGENAILAVPQANFALTSAEVERAKDVIAGAQMLVLQQEVAFEANLTAARIAQVAGIPILFNPAPIAPRTADLLDLATTVVANEVESAAITPGAASHAEELRHFKVPSAVITLGAAGCMARFGEEEFSTAAFPVAAIDSVGAGDAFCGALAVALTEGMAPSAALRFASAAGALAVTKHGAAASLPHRPDVETLVATG